MGMILVYEGKLNGSLTCRQARAQARRTPDPYIRQETINAT